MRKYILLLLAAALAVPAAARDMGHRSGLSLGGRAAYLEPDDSQAGGGEFHGGAQLRLGLGEIFAIEGSADYRQAEFRNRTLDIFPVQASLLAFVMPGKAVSPFILAGAGWYYTSVRDGDTDNRFGPHVGGGIHAFIHPRWSIDATYRYLFIDDVENVGDVTDADFDDRGHMGTVGINFHF